MINELRKKINDEIAAYNERIENNKLAINALSKIGKKSNHMEDTIKSIYRDIEFCHEVITILKDLNVIASN